MHYGYLMSANEIFVGRSNFGDLEIILLEREVP